MEGYRCVVCDSEMSPSPLEAECSYCGKREKTDYICPRGHYVCEECRLSDAEKLVRKTCKHIKDGDPLRIAKLLMRHPAVSMHGPEHHYLVGAVILAALRNRGFPVTSSMVDEAIARAKRVPLGSCGLWGACGAAIGAGVGFSVALRVDMMSGEKRAQALRLVAGVLEEISRLGGPRCCKASVALAIMAARRLLNEKHGVVFDESTLFRCPFAMKNPDCLKEGCPFYAGRGESS